MNKAVLLLLLLPGCATQPTLEDLMRTSYEVGCAEARLKYIKGALQDHEAQTAGVIELCKDRSKTFDLHQVGIYDNAMSIVYKTNQPHR